MAKILVYSAIKIKANGPLLYSVLNPETSSDSPSAISNGVRFVSANIVTSQIKNIGKIMIMFRGSQVNVIWDIEYVWVIKRALSKIRDILTS